MGPDTSPNFVWHDCFARLSYAIIGIVAWKGCMIGRQAKTFFFFAQGMPGGKPACLPVIACSYWVIDFFGIYATCVAFQRRRSALLIRKHIAEKCAAPVRIFQEA
jgi:hypothetical protein